MASLTAAVSLPAQAAPVLFDFENQPIFTETPFSLANGGVTASFAGPADVDPGAFGILSNFLTPTGFQYRLMQGDFLTIGSAFGASGSVLTITFSAPLTSFSLDFGLDDPDNASTLSFLTNGGDTGTIGGALSAGFRYPEGTLSFAGAAFTTLTLQSNAIDFQIDNLQANTVAAVSEPASLALLATGLPLIAAVRRRSKDRSGASAMKRKTNA
jgi:hypothetical protein